MLLVVAGNFFLQENSKENKKTWLLGNENIYSRAGFCWPVWLLSFSKEEKLKQNTGGAMDDFEFRVNNGLLTANGMDA